MSWVAIFALVALAAALGGFGLDWALERSATRRLANASDLPALEAAVRRLSAEPRAAVGPVVNALAADSPPEPALLEALSKLAAARFGPSRPLLGVRELALLVAGCAPLVLGIFGAVQATGAAVEHVRGLPLPVVQLDAEPLLLGPFEALAGAFVEGGFALGCLVGLWVVHGWLLAPSVREARHVRALLEAVVRIAPQAPLLVPGRAAAALGPDRELLRPAFAAFGWFGAVTVAWLAMMSAVTPDEEPAPFESLRRVELPSGLELSVARGGQPVSDAGATLAVGPSEVRIGSTPFAPLEEGRLPRDFRTTARRTSAGRNELTGPFVVVVHRTVPASTVLELLEFLRERGGASPVQIVHERPSGEQVGLRAAFGDPPSSALRVALEAGGGLSLDGEPSSALGIQGEVRRRLRDTGQVPAVAVSGLGQEPWGRVAEVLGWADDACPSAAECSRLGLGVRVWLTLGGGSR